jgi:large subunit ribosomal protein L15
VLQNELRPPKGAKHARKRVGRGNASGHGTYSTRGIKGAKARSGWRRKPGFEGGQTPLFRRLKYQRGFNNKWRVEFAEVNVGQLARFPAGTAVTPDLLRETGLVKTSLPVKILGEGDLAVALNVTADRFSASARAKIEAVGGRVVELMPSKRAAKAAPPEATDEAPEVAGTGPPPAASEAPEVAAPAASAAETQAAPGEAGPETKPKRSRSRKQSETPAAGEGEGA